ncbi:MAG: hypothetical protein Q9213_004184 [Squamulea squamosa]
MADLQGRKVFKVFNQDFIVDERYNVTKELGQGAYGIVCAATNNQTGEGVAIKKVTNVFSKKILAKRALREIKLLQHFRGHRNITCLYDMDIPRPDNFNETYLYEELMECDLAAIIRSGQPLTDAHFQSFIYQILCGLKYIHSANVLHRDLKPGNLLVNADCELKICDFGLARGFSMDPEENAGYMTEYVATRWYRAPEIMLSFQSYTKAIDVWSVGCILAELLGGRPFFKGRDYVDQLNQILHYLGTPNEETLSRIGSPRAQEYVRNLPFMPKVPFQRLFNNANPDALDLLDRMLAFDPSSRISVEEALEHRYLHIWHDASDEPNCPETFDFHFEIVEDVPEMRKMILAEVQRFRQYVRVQQPQSQMGGPMGQSQSNVPIPDNAGQWSQEDPRPQEASAPHHTQNMGLEEELEGGLDAMHQDLRKLGIATTKLRQQPRAVPCRGYLDRLFQSELRLPTIQQSSSVRPLPKASTSIMATKQQGKYPSSSQLLTTIVKLVPQGDDTDFTRVILLSPSANSVFIGRASKTASKGLVAAPDNAWFDSPIMSRQHGKISVTSSGVVQLQDLGSTHGTWVQNKRLTAKEICDLQDGVRITFGSTVASGPVTYHARSFIVELPASCGQQEPPTSSNFKGSERSGFRVPDDKYESLSDGSEAGDCQIMASHPRTFSVPSSGDEVDDSDDDVDLVNSTSEDFGLPASKSHRLSNAKNPWFIGVKDQPSTTESQAGSAMDPIELDQAPRMVDQLDYDTDEEDEPAKLGKDANINGHSTRVSTPESEIPDTYASMSRSAKQFCASQGETISREMNELPARAPLAEINILSKPTDGGENAQYHLANPSSLASAARDAEGLALNKSELGTTLPADNRHITVTTNTIELHGQPTVDDYESSPEPEQIMDLKKPETQHAEVQLGNRDSPSGGIRSPELVPTPGYMSEDESEDDDSLLESPPARRAAINIVTSEGSQHRPSSLHKSPFPPFDDLFRARSNADELPTLHPTTSINPHSLSDTRPSILKYAFKTDPLYLTNSTSETTRAPSPSDAALARKAPPYPAERQNPLYDGVTPPDDWLDVETHPYMHPWRAPTFNSLQGNGFRSASAYSQNLYDDYMNGMSEFHTHPIEPDEYQQGPFSRNYGSFHSVAVPSTAARRPPSPPAPAPQAPQKSCLVRLKVDAKASNEEDYDLCPNLEEIKSKKVDISSLVNSHTDGGRGLKRKSDLISSEEPVNDCALASSQSSPSTTASEDDLGPHAQVHDTAIAVSNTISQGLISSDTRSLPSNAIGEIVEEGPARKKAKLCPTKAGTVGKVVSGICLGLAGAFAAFIAATPADVWDEALREAVKLA